MLTKLTPEPKVRSAKFLINFLAEHPTKSNSSFAYQLQKYYKLKNWKKINELLVFLEVLSEYEFLEWHERSIGKVPKFLLKGSLDAKEREEWKLAFEKIEMEVKRQLLKEELGGTEYGEDEMEDIIDDFLENNDEFEK